MKRSLYYISMTAITVLLAACGTQQDTPQGNNIETSKSQKSNSEYHTSILKWFEDGKQIRSDDGNLQSLSSTYNNAGIKSESYLFKKFDIDINDIKQEAGNTIVTAFVKERYGNSSESDESGSNSTYQFTFSNAEGSNKISSIKQEIAPGKFFEYESLKETLKNPKIKNLIEQGNKMDSDVLKAQRAGYNGTAAANYARTYAYNYNTQYSRADNDCTNFISQALKSGGWQEFGWAYWDRSRTDLWFYSVAPTWSYTWAIANDWNKYGFSSGRIQKVSSISSLGIGDIIQTDWEDDGRIDHSVIITQTPSTSTGYKLTYHSTDNKDLPWADFVARAGSRTSYYYFKVIYSDNP